MYQHIESVPTCRDTNNMKTPTFFLYILIPTVLHKPLRWNIQQLAKSEFIASKENHVAVFCIVRTTIDSMKEFC